MKLDDCIKILSKVRQEHGNVEISYLLEENLTSEGRIKVSDDVIHFFIQQPGGEKRREVKKIEFFELDEDGKYKVWESESLKGWL